MVSSNLEQYAIADFIEWDETRQLKLNPYFQRQSVWPAAAKSYLIDTVLRHLPMPKIFMRTSVDVETQRTYREIVDGQQRLRTILDFAHDRFALTGRAGDYQGLRYSTLDGDLKASFLSYRISVDQLINATDDDVLEIFSRLNSYTVPVNAPELRHAKYAGEFKWAVHEASNSWRGLWEELGVVSQRERIRLMSDSVMAEMFGIILEGVRDGGQPKINALYERNDKEFDRSSVEPALEEIIPTLLGPLAPPLLDTPLHSAPHFLMVFAALAHIVIGIPGGELEIEVPRGALAGWEESIPLLYAWGEVVAQDEPPSDDVGRAFWRASKSSTQRISSRRLRFPIYVRALQGMPLD